MTTTIPEDKETLEGYVTSEYLCRMFNKKLITLIEWRKRRGLPYVEIPSEDRPAIRYRLDKVLEWARKNGKRIYPVTSSSEADATTDLFDVGAGEQ